MLNITYCKKNVRDVENTRYRNGMNIIAQILEPTNNDDEEEEGLDAVANLGQSKNGSLTERIKANQNNDDDDNNKDNPLARLLIVDDDPDIAEVLKLCLLNENRFLVDAFTNPEEALRHFQSNSHDYYSLVLSDIRMPEMSGTQLARKVKEINSRVKVVLMTAYDIRGDKSSEAFLSAIQVDGFIQKPIRINDLINRIFDIVDESKRRA